MARLDRLGHAAREVAQAGAAIGREFGYGLLAGIIDSDGYASNGCCDLVFKAEALAHDVVYLARSLGLGPINLGEMGLSTRWALGSACRGAVAKFGNGRRGIEELASFGGC